MSGIIIACASCPECGADLEVTFDVIGSRRAATRMRPAEEPDVSDRDVPHTCDMCGTSFDSVARDTLCRDAFENFLATTRG